jgi:rhodanese-related sulfurtransferase
MSSPTFISPTDLAQASRQPNAPLLLDVRTPVEVRESSIASTTQIPLDELKAEEFTRAHGKDVPVVVICRSGARAQKAAGMLTACGMGNVAVLEGGMQAWETAGLPVQRDHKVMALERQVRIAIGLLVLLGWALGMWVHPAWFGLCAFMGAGLIFSGVANFCGLALILARAPWNRTPGATCTPSVK